VLCAWWGGCGSAVGVGVNARWKARGGGGGAVWKAVVLLKTVLNNVTSSRPYCCSFYAISCAVFCAPDAAGGAE